MVDLQRLHEQYAEQGLVILGFDSTDDREIAEDLLKKYAVTYRCILDNSTVAQLLRVEDYHVEAVPTTYVIDREGNVAAAWVGHQPDDPQRTEVLRKLGFK